MFEAQLVKSTNAHLIMYLTTGLAIIIGAALSFYLIRMITRPLNYATLYINRMANGDLDFIIEKFDSRDESGQIIASTAAISATLKAVMHDLHSQITAAKEGALSVRANAIVHPGLFVEIVEGVNMLFDTLSDPMNEIAAVMAKLASGDIRGRIMGDYKDELRALKGNVSRSLDALVNLLDAISVFSSKLAVGDLTAEIEGAFQGEFATIKKIEFCCRIIMWRYGKCR